MHDIHPTIMAILQGRKIKTNTKLDLGDAAWADAWQLLGENEKPTLAKQWLKQLHARATHSRSLDDDLYHSLARHGDWVSQLWPYISQDWFSNQNLGGSTGQLATQLALLQSKNPDLLRFTWIADAQERANYLATRIFISDYTSGLANFSEYLQMSRHPTILPRLWAGAVSTGVTKQHESAMARLVAARSLDGASNSLVPAQFKVWNDLGQHITITRAYTVFPEVDACRRVITSLPLTDVLLPLAATLERANSMYSRGDTLLRNSGLTPAGQIMSPYCVMRAWYPEYTAVWDAADSLDEPMTTAARTLLAQIENTIKHDFELPDFEV